MKTIVWLRLGACTLAALVGGCALTVAVQSDGKLVVAGSADLGDRDAFVLARYSPDGRPDPAFGGGAPVTTSFAP